MTVSVRKDRPACKTLALTIRRAQTQHEIDAAAAIYEQAGRKAFTWRPIDHFKAADFKRHALDEEVWLAVFGESIVGVLSLYRSELFVHSLYVDPDAQGLGVGRALVERVREDAGGALTLKVDAPNEAAIGFYERTGWKRLSGNDDRGIDDQGVTWLRYRLG